jgi:peptidoglycan/LPS O-acetylase OafA/YrhL
MIQRIQTVYLFIAAIALTIFGYYKVTPPYTETQTTYLFANGIFSLLLALAAIITIFLYKQRKTQLTTIRILLGIIMVNLPLLYFINNSANVFTTYSNLFLLIAFICLFLSHNNIEKDEKLLKSLNRLR